MINLNLGSVELPPEAATKTFAILAKRGAGKSYTGAVMAEEFYKAGVPFVVFDPIDVWWGLRFAKDGKSEGLPIVVFGLEHADIPLTKDMGRQIARAIVKENISCVISTFGMPKNQQRYLITEFAEELLNINKTPRHIFIEEAHEFIPQKVFGGLGAVFNAVSNLVVMGRNRGLGVTFINQRAATVNKDVLTQLDTLLAFRNTAPQDRKALKEWVEFHSAEGDFEEFMKSLPSLPTGEGWIWSPEFLNIFQRIKIRERETFHPDREKLGTTFEMPKLEPRSIQAFIQSFKSGLFDTKAQRSKDLLAPQNASYGHAEQTSVADEVQTLRNQIIDLAEEHQKELDAKDIIIEKLETKIEAIRKIIGNGDNHETALPKSGQLNTNQIDMWSTKFGQGSATKILRMLAEKYPARFTSSQIRMFVGISAKSSGYPTAMRLLRGNNLIKEESGYISINPELLTS